MSKTWKIVLIALAVVVLVGAGWLIGRGSGGGAIEHSVQFSLSVNPSGDFALAITPADQSCTKGQVVTYTVTITPSGGFDVPVQLTVGGLPIGSYAWSMNPVQPGTTTTTLTVDTTALQSNTVYSCTLSAHDI